MIGRKFGAGLAGRPLLRRTVRRNPSISLWSADGLPISLFYSSSLFPSHIDKVYFWLRFFSTGRHYSSRLNILCQARCSFHLLFFLV
ncbi:hypothetical protein Nepgr_028418 [Nepenthes gracilis]|uniref:Uncharacterized protein n=1 Tax=Nepenthes gracilis TaxID=150966 RepID=A0AAD3TBM8_NEPGR|nr:hypothetical protein Nepgr_028418 [Nepenthes gracilis]